MRRAGGDQKPEQRACAPQLPKTRALGLEVNMLAVSVLLAALSLSDLVREAQGQNCSPGLHEYLEGCLDDIGDLGNRIQRAYLGTV